MYLFKVGDILRFKEEGLEDWATLVGGKNPPIERYQKWRWEVVALNPASEFWIDLRRIDVRGKRATAIHTWYAKFFRLDESDSVLMSKINRG